MNTLLKDYYTSLHIDERVFDYCQKIEDSLKDRFAAIDAKRSFKLSSIF